jgi:hypothetical protein
VKIITGKGIRQMTLQMHLEANIGNIKTKIHDKIGIPTILQRLTLLTKKLDDDQCSLQEYDVQKEQIISCLLSDETGIKKNASGTIYYEIDPQKSD